MEASLFDPFFQSLRLNLKPHFKEEIINSILADLWGNTWDKIIDKYSIPDYIFPRAIKVLENMELDLDIFPYRDYSFIKKMECPKYFVTTSLTSIQQLKIKALNLENDFIKIVINDPFKGKKTKLDVFKELVSEFDLTPGNTFVIGDNIESEIKAGNALNMITIQILREGVVKGNTARHYIHSFEEIEAIISGY